MPMIDLDTGSLTDEEVGVFPSEPIQDVPPVSGGIINLDTGSFESAEPVVQQVEPIVEEEEPFGIRLPFTTPVPELPEFITGKERETRATRELPELGKGGLLSGEDAGKIAVVAPVLLSTLDPREIGNILSAQFENIGITEDEKGNLIANNNATGAKVVINKPGVSQLDVLQGLGIAAAFTPAARATAAGSTLTQKAIIGGVGAGLTETALQIAQKQTGGEASKEDIALASALGVAAEVAVPLIQRFRQARQAKAIGAEAEEVAKAVESVKPVTTAIEEVEKATGQRVGIFPAQQTQIPSQLLKQRILPQLDAGARKAATALEVQNKEVFEATTRLINTIAPEGSVVSAAKRFREVSKLAIDSAKQRRELAVKPFYDDALNLGADVDVKATSGMIDDILKEAPPGSEFESIGNKLKNLILGKDGAQPTLRQLQKAKITMQDMIDAVGDKGVSGTIKREIIGVKKQLVDSMSEASPLFRAAEDEFIRLSPAVKKLEDSILSQVSKVKDTQLKNIAQNIFDPKAALTDPASIIQAKKVINSVDPQAWDDLLRVEMNRRLGGLETLIDDIPGDFVGNIPGQLRRTLFGNPSQRKALFAGMNDQQKQSFKYLETILKRASSGRAAGSPTAPFKEIIEKLKGVSLIIRDSIFRPLSTLQQTGERSLFDRNVAALTDVMFDPKFAPQMKKLIKLNPDSPAAARALAQLLKNATSTREKEQEQQ